MIGYIEDLQFKVDTCEHKISKLNKEINDMEKEKNRLKVWCDNIHETLPSELSILLLARYQQDINKLLMSIARKNVDIAKLTNDKNNYAKLITATSKYL